MFQLQKQHSFVFFLKHVFASHVLRLAMLLHGLRSHEVPTFCYNDSVDKVQPFSSTPEIFGIFTSFVSPRNVSIEGRSAGSRLTHSAVLAQTLGKHCKHGKAAGPSMTDVALTAQDLAPKRVATHDKDL